MVEVDPMLLITAGSIAVGLAAAALCLRAPAKQSDKKIITNKKVEQVATVKPKKKAAKTVKKVVSAPANDSAAESDESEIAALIADIGHVDLQPKPVKKAKEAAKVSGPTAAEVAATKAAAKRIAEAAEAVQKAHQKAEAAEEAARLIAIALAAEEEAKKSKKAKETPEQRAARLDRQRLAKVKKVEEEELSKTAAIQLAAVESKLVSRVSITGNIAQPVQVDGWAVVEDKRKVRGVKTIKCGNCSHQRMLNLFSNYVWTVLFIRIVRLIHLYIVKLQSSSFELSICNELLQLLLMEGESEDTSSCRCCRGIRSH